MKADPPGAPIFHLLLRARLDALDELLHCLERASVAQEQIDQGRKSPIIIHRPLSPSLVHVATTRSPSLVSPVDAKILPRPLALKEPRGDPLDTINGTFDLRLGVCRCAHSTRERHDTILPPRFSQDRGWPPRMEPHGSRQTVKRQLPFPSLGPLRRQRLWLVQALRLQAAPPVTAAAIEAPAALAASTAPAAPRAAPALAIAFPATAVVAAPTAAIAAPAAAIVPAPLAEAIVAPTDDAVLLLSSSPPHLSSSSPQCSEARYAMVSVPQPEGSRPPYPGHQAHH